MSAKKILRPNIALQLFLQALLVIFTARSEEQTLDTFLLASQIKNPILLENHNLAIVARLEVDKARAQYSRPEITTTANFLYAPIFHGVGYDESITNGQLYSAQVNLNLPLFVRPQLEAQIKNSLVNQQVYGQKNVVAQHDLNRQLTEQYILTWQNLDRLANTRRLLDILDEQEKLVRAFAENAILSQSDVLFFKIERENQELALQDYEIAYRQGLATLQLLSGQVDTTYFDLEPPVLQLNVDTFGISNFLLSYRLDSLLAASNQEVSELKYRPQLTAFANYGLNAIMVKDIYKRFGFSVGFNFSMTLYDGNQRQLTRQQTELNQRTTQAQRDYQARQAQQQRLLALQQIHLLDKKIEVMQHQLADYETLLKFYRERIAKGELSVNDYMNTIKSYATAQGDFTSLKTSRLLLVNAYNYWNW